MFKVNFALSPNEISEQKLSSSICMDILFVRSYKTKENDHMIS